jgi:hypothetical protein
MEPIRRRQHSLRASDQSAMPDRFGCVWPCRWLVSLMIIADMNLTFSYTATKLLIIRVSATPLQPTSRSTSEGLGSGWYPCFGLGCLARDTASCFRDLVWLSLANVSLQRNKILHRRLRGVKYGRRQHARGTEFSE